MKTYKRIKNAIKNNFSFTDTEVDAAFSAYIDRKDIFSSEAVNAFGGFKQLIKASIYAQKRVLRQKLEARKTLSLSIVQDEHYDSPRDWDNLGTMVCFHNRYDLGDKHNYSIEEAQSLLKRKDVLALPLYLYDHSGLSISASSFSCQWDSGQVGFIFVTHEKIKKDFNVKRLTKKVLENAKKSLLSEVKAYDQYLTGDVYGYSITDANGEHIDSCYGFFGYEYCKSEAESQLKYFNEKYNGGIK